MTFFKQSFPYWLTLPSCFLCCSLCFLGACQQAPDVETEDEFSKHIRTTDARTPAEEQAGFRVPPGFEIQLFAAEPDIGKPLNMAFDAKGRMWLTQSYEYPFPDTTGNPKDKISILEDTDGDGRADKFTVFAEGLNIPIGIVPVSDGAVAYNIPSIDHFIDSDGDGKADDRKMLYTGFRYEDTHGMINNLVRSWDGWVHADHGFANISTVAGTDGDTIVMNSGNTFRFRLDGSRVEFTTTGRVNPYGYAYDELGYTYSSDCHTSPIYQIIRGADYPHFGKKPTGIGFGPALMEHNYGSTALAGLEYYLGEQFPETYQNSFYLGDVVKCRVYRSTMKMQGTTPFISWEDDFVVSEDPWFRPVDVKMGPDGALYIADFYNRIIGHYEVPLDHPGRDRQRGRIWRIVYRGEEQKADTPVRDWTTASLDELIDGLDDENLPLRMRLADEIVDRFGTEAADAVLNMATSAGKSSRQYVQALWILYRLEALPDDLLASAITGEDVVAGVHALRILFEYKKPDESLLKLAAAALRHSSPHVQRQAVMVVSQNPRVEHMEPLLDLRGSASEDDSHFLYAARQSLRDHLRDPKILFWTLNRQWKEEDSRILADLMRGVDDVDASRFLLKHLAQYDEPEEQIVNYAKHAARFVSERELDQLISALQTRAAGDLDREYLLFNRVREGLAQEGKKMNAKGKDWGIALASVFLKSNTELADQWQVVPHLHHPYPANPWRLAELSVNDSPDMVRAIVSGPTQNSGREVSSIYSPAFALSESLDFYLFGRKNKAGENETPAKAVNCVELRLAENDSLIAKTCVTALETAERISLSTKAYAGRQAYLALIDASTRWGEFVGIGEIQPAKASLPAESPNQEAERQIFAAKLAEEYRATEFQPALETLLRNEKADVYARAAAAAAIMEIAPDQGLKTAAGLLEKEQESYLFKEELALLISEVIAPEAAAILFNHMGDLSYEKQKEIAVNMSGWPHGINALLSAAEQGRISPRLLLERQVREILLAETSKHQSTQLAEITTNIKPPGAEIDALINDRLRGFNAARHSIAQGSQISAQYCSPCHEIKGEGGNIGPQLDGIGNWGARALSEKILDPNRNISKAFKNYTIKLKDGNTSAGLFRREEGELLVFANILGEEFSVAKEDIAERKLSPYTLMPDNFAQAIPEEDYYALLAFLLNER